MNVLDNQKVVLFRLFGRRLLGPLKKDIGVLQGGNGQNAAHEHLCHGGSARRNEAEIGAHLGDGCLVKQRVTPFPLPFSFLENEAELLDARHGEGR